MNLNTVQACPDGAGEESKEKWRAKPAQHLIAGTRHSCIVL